MNDVSGDVTNPGAQNEYKLLVASGEKLHSDLTALATETQKRYRSLLKRRKWWQTGVVVSTSISTGLAGYMAQDGIPITGRLTLAVIVALAGAVAAVRDAWQVNEALDDCKARYTEIRTLSAELERATYDADGSSRNEDRLSKLGPVVRRTQARLKDLRDDLVELKSTNPG